MGNFFKNLFKSKSKETAAEVAPKNCLVAVADGDIIPLSEVPDPVFAEKMAGDGAAIPRGCGAHLDRGFEGGFSLSRLVRRAQPPGKIPEHEGAVSRASGGA